MKLRLQNLQRFYKQIIMLFIDLFLILFSLYFAFILRLGEPFPVEYLLPSWWVFVFTPIYCKTDLYIPSLTKNGIIMVGANTKTHQDGNR